MANNNFKKQLGQMRAAVPQVDPEGVKPTVPAYPVESVVAAPPAVVEPTPAEIPQPPQPAKTQTQPSASDMYRITVVDTSEDPVNRGFFMYPSRHRQIAKDLAYIEDRKPWQIIETALEEYVVKHYGKEYKRK